MAVRFERVRVCVCVQETKLASAAKDLSPQIAERSGTSGLTHNFEHLLNRFYLQSVPSLALLKYQSGYMSLSIIVSGPIPRRSRA